MLIFVEIIVCDSIFLCTAFFLCESSLHFFSFFVFPFPFLFFFFFKHKNNQQAGQTHAGNGTVQNSYVKRVTWPGYLHNLQVPTPIIPFLPSSTTFVQKKSLQNQQ